MKNKIPGELIQKYLAGKCSPAEKRIIDEWYAGFEEAPDFIDAIAVTAQDQLKKDLFTRINENITEAEKDREHEAETKVFSINQFSPFKKVAFTISKIAAMLLLAAGIGFIAYNNFSEKRASVVSTTGKIFNNPGKQVKIITLPDRSRVWLQENSQLTVSNDFNQIKRAVTLTGEAFFEVAKDKNRPFEITTGGVLTRVLGTSFNIKAYTKDPTVEISVITGQVAVLKNEPEPITSTDPLASPAILLLPNQKVTYQKENQALIKKKVLATDRQLVWARTSVYFQDTPIREVIKKLNEQFATNIKPENPAINNCSIYGDFTNQNLPEILEVICKSIEAEYKLYKNEIIISGAGCLESKPLP